MRCSPLAPGLITIENFEARAAEETLAAVDALVEQGASSLIFDVRYNPGGFTTELVEILDALLPEGPLFRTESSDGQGGVVLRRLARGAADGGSGQRTLLLSRRIFAAAMQEYDAAVIVGAKTSGKGYYQRLFPLVDGSAASISLGEVFYAQWSQSDRHWRHAGCAGGSGSGSCLLPLPGTVGS